MSPVPGHSANLGARTAADAWSLTAKISPRRVVRAAAVDADGQPLNAYPLVHPITGAQPSTPWAVHLADAQGRYRLLCADLDAKSSGEVAAADAKRLSRVLSELGIPHLVCASGPTGGRHVWLGMRESMDAEVVCALAYLLKAWLPTLDVAPLVNPTSGCVRPPGAPHRLGGVSQVIAGSVRALTDVMVTTDEVHALMTRIAEHLQLAAPSSAPRQRRPIAEAKGMPFLPGKKRPLSAGCRALLAATPTGDLSAVLWRVLCGAAAARWRFADVAAIADAPGLRAGWRSPVRRRSRWRCQRAAAFGNCRSPVGRRSASGTPTAARHTVRSAIVCPVGCPSVDANQAGVRPVVSACWWTVSASSVTRRARASR